MAQVSFNDAFESLTGNKPFPWLRRLYEDWLANGTPPSACNIPTGLGKTSVIAVWLIALAYHREKLPRRLVYVVNRRTVVDQTTDEVERLRKNLGAAGLLDPLKALCALPLERDASPLAISTLRGQFADNREWSADPARPAVISGTVDMIGSRLLFGGYGVGFKGKPLHAGFLGQDVLLVHDEAHLEPAFQELIEKIELEQRERERVGNLPCRKLQVMALTATTRSDSSRNTSTLELTEAERKLPVQIPDPPTEPLHVAWRRLRARKAIHLHPIDDEKKLVEEIAGRALSFRNSGRAILVFARAVHIVVEIAAKLSKETKRKCVQQLTGTMRGLERDALPCDPIFARFLPPSNRPEGATLAEGTVYLVCTSAGEVGVNISADHLVCDLTTFESMAQRFGRVNRFGDCTDTEIHVVHPTESDEEDDYETRLEKTLDLLGQLKGDGSPAALGQLDSKARQDAFAPTPIILPVTDILLDSWALTSIRSKLPGRPPVEPYLHGLENEFKAETYIAWRQEVWELRCQFTSDRERTEFEQFATDLLEDYPLKPNELLRDSTYRKNTGIRDKLAILASRHPDYPVWIQEPDGTLGVTSLGYVPSVSLAGRTVILPPQAGGLRIDNGRSAGLFDASEYQQDSHERYDVADAWLDEDGTPRRCRNVWGDDKPPEDMRLVRTIDTKPNVDEEDLDEATTKRYWHWYVRPRSADDDGSKTSNIAVTLKDHTTGVEQAATRLADALLARNPELYAALVTAARFHDLGKNRDVWQRGIGNDRFPEESYAKSGRLADGRKLCPRQLNDTYRHEFGSLRDMERETDFQKLKPDTQDLVLHLIATHHGRGRPHFHADEVFDPKRDSKDPEAIAAEVPRRFARLQRRYGRWGLAYLESLLRAADWAASANPSLSEGQQ